MLDADDVSLTLPGTGSFWTDEVILWSGKLADLVLFVTDTGIYHLQAGIVWALNSSHLGDISHALGIAFGCDYVWHINVLRCLERLVGPLEHPSEITEQFARGEREPLPRALYARDYAAKL